MKGGKIMSKIEFKNGSSVETIESQCESSRGNKSNLFHYWNEDAQLWECWYGDELQYCLTWDYKRVGEV